MASDPFSISRARSSLYLFGAGKLISGIVGVVWMITLVRTLGIEDYGAYVILLALLEIVLLVSNGGVYAFAQRYITEGRLPKNQAFLPRLIWLSFGYRLITLALAATAVAQFALPMSAMLHQPILATVLLAYSLVFVFEGAARYLELSFESMLEQARAQTCAVFRNSLRLLGIFALTNSKGEIGILDVVYVEAVASGIGLLLAVGIMFQSMQAVQQQAKHEEVGPTKFGRDRILSFILPAFFAQLLTQLYSQDTIKLLVSRLLGVAEAAVFGFAHAISNIILRYLPANLLSGLIRPMLVARRSNGGSDADLMAIGNLILKVNLFVLLPLAVLFAVAGREFATLLSDGKYPSAGPMLCLLTLLLILMGIHVVLSMLAAAIEDRRAVLLGTIMSIPGVCVGIAIAPALGSIAMIIGLWISELLWCASTIWQLGKRGFSFRLAWSSMARLCAAALIAACAAICAIQLLDVSGIGLLLTSIAVIAVVYIASCFALKPLTQPESEMLLRLAPGRFRKL